MPQRDPFDQLQALLIAEIPRKVKSLRAPGPLAVLRIIGYDTCAPEGAVEIRTISEGCRKELLAQRGISAPHYLWFPGEDCGEKRAYLPPPSYLAKWTDRFSRARRELKAVFVEIYERLEADEGAAMAIYGQTLQRVARELNALDWNPICPVTDDFVVAAVDGREGGVDILAGLVGSIPAERIDILRRRRLLGPESNWEYALSVPCEILGTPPELAPLDPQSEIRAKAFGNELILHAPAQCQEIHCVVRKGVAEEGHQTLFYNMSYPRFPEQATTIPSGCMDSIAWQIAYSWSRKADSFTGFTLICRKNEEGRWSISLEHRTNIR